MRMAWYQRQIDGTVEFGEADETETDRMWRQIDPTLAYLMQQAANGREDSGD